eukprot:CAMPEP_0167759206 /NCGR_PEP_ID=MMETSP0110_2-20121227/10893_1 /TAXON_ID=629695 /ORGANISM="Gymnochlora sp., Strain CCMP2014" /LENGTH=682 /DNA_ID=CAMNT_0007645563 /DNA_START=1648 /DNA_END=3696 /DNA_ORIENTATION=+
MSEVKDKAGGKEGMAAVGGAMGASEEGNRSKDKKTGPVQVPKAQDHYLRERWKEGSKLFVRFSRFGWIAGTVKSIFWDEQGEWLKISAKGGTAIKDCIRFSQHLRPIIPESLQKLAKEYTLQLTASKSEKQVPKMNQLTDAKPVGALSSSRPSRITIESQNLKSANLKESLTEAESIISTDDSSAVIKPSPLNIPTSNLSMEKVGQSALPPEKKATAATKALTGLVDKVQAGTVRDLKEVEEQHAQFELVFALLHGLKHSIVKAYPPRATTKKMCNEADKYNFSHQASGSVMPLPSHINLKSFEFKVYAPKAFFHIRNVMGIKPEEFMLSICFNKYIEFISNSKSGAFFYYSNDGKFLIKTVEKAEANCLTGMLFEYQNHLRDNPHTRLCRMYGLYRLSLGHSLAGLRGTKFYFIIMESVFYTARFIHLIYDLKGSSHGRAATEKDFKRQPTRNFTCTVLKDNDLRESKQKIVLGDRAKDMQVQIAKDAAFLAKQGIIDYSLLIGIHYPLKADPRKMQAEKERKITGKNPLWDQISTRGRSPTVPIDVRAGYKSEMKNIEFEGAEEERKKITAKLDRNLSKIWKENTPSTSKKKEAKHTRGILSATKLASPHSSRKRSIMSDAATKEVYFIGIIDILVQYGLRKRGEYLYKSKLKGLGDSVSVIPPDKYRERFKGFAESFIE